MRKRKINEVVVDFDEVIAASVSRVLQHSADPAFRETCFQLLGVNTSGDAKERLNEILSKLTVKSSQSQTSQQLPQPTMVTPDKSIDAGSVMAVTYMDIGTAPSTGTWFQEATKDLSDWK